MMPSSEDSPQSRRERREERKESGVRGQALGSLKPQAFFSPLDAIFMDTARRSNRPWRVKPAGETLMPNAQCLMPNAFFSPLDALIPRCHLQKTHH